MIPPNIDRIHNTDALKAIVEQIRDGMNQLSDYLNNVGAAAHPDLVELLRAEGLEARGRFGGSSAEKTATEFHKLLKKTADHAIATAKVAEATYLFWLKHVKQPIEAARAARAKQPRINV